MYNAKSSGVLERGSSKYGKGYIRPVFVADFYTIDDVEYPMPEAVDLGLPSGTKWANMNIGASLSYDYGLYFSWGETVPKDEYTYTNYIYTKELNDIGNPIYSKYNEEDNLTSLDYSDDAAYMSTKGTFKTPTKNQFTELIDNTCITEKQYNNITYLELQSKINGNTIQIPLSGWIYSSQPSSPSHINFYGRYYTNEIDGWIYDCDYNEFLFNSGAIIFDYCTNGIFDAVVHFSGCSRTVGLPIRSVYCK